MADGVEEDVPGHGVVDSAQPVPRRRGRAAKPLEYAPGGESYLGSRIRELRDLMGATQEVVARSLGIDRAALAKIETNAAAPSLQLLAKIEAFFGPSAGDLKHAPIHPRVLGARATPAGGERLAGASVLPEAALVDLERRIAGAVAEPHRRLIEEVRALSSELQAVKRILREVSLPMAANFGTSGREFREEVMASSRAEAPQSPMAGLTADDGRHATDAALEMVRHHAESQQAIQQEIQRDVLSCIRQNGSEKLSRRVNEGSESIVLAGNVASVQAAARLVGAVPLTFYPPNSREFQDAIAHAEREEGDRLLVLDGLGDITCPPEINESRADSLRDRDAAKASTAWEIAALRAERWTNARDRLGTHQFQDICSAGAIEHFRMTGIPAGVDALTALGCRRETDEEIEAHLRAVLKLMENENYQLALLGRRHADICRTFWLVKQGHAVLLEAWRRGGQAVDVNVEIKTPVIVEAFSDSFQLLWDQIPDRAKDKDEVRSFIEKQIRRIGSQVRVA